MSKWDEYDLDYHGGTYGGLNKLSKAGSGKKYDDEWTYLCAACGVRKERKAYNSKQFKKKGKRQCLECLENPPAAKPAADGAPEPSRTIYVSPTAPPPEEEVPAVWDASGADDDDDDMAAAEPAGPELVTFNDQDDEDEVMSDWDASSEEEVEEVKPVHQKHVTKRQQEKAQAEKEAERKRQREENMANPEWREQEAARLKREQEEADLDQIRDAFGDLAADDLSDYEGPEEDKFDSYADADWLGGGDDDEPKKEEEIPDAWDADSEEEVVVVVEKKEKKKKEKKKKKKKAAVVADDDDFDFDQGPAVDEEKPVHKEPKQEQKLAKIVAPDEPEGPIAVEKPKPRKKGKKKLGAHLKAKETSTMGESLDEFDFF